MVIGKSEKPRCFRKVKNLPVIYEANKKAWMTSQIFNSYVSKWNKQLVRENRKILLLIDNCPSHTINSLSNIKVIYLPKNTTSVLQPCDQGIIKCIKGRYRMHMMKKLILNVEIGKSEEKVNILDAIYMITSAWNDINQSTIRNCFKKAGIIKDAIIEEEQTNDADDWNFLIETSKIEVDKNVLITFDDGLEISDQDFNILSDDVTKETDEEKEDDVIEEKITTQEALMCIDKLKKYCCNIDNCDINVNNIHNIERSIINHRINNLRQPTIIDFINKF